MGPNSKSLQTTILNFMKISGSCLNGKKTLWVKEKLLIMSNFSFSHSVFKVPYRVENIVRKGEICLFQAISPFSHNIFQSYISLVRQNTALCGNGLKSYNNLCIFARIFYVNMESFMTPTCFWFEK